MDEGGCHRSHAVFHPIHRVPAQLGRSNSDHRVPISRQAALGLEPGRFQIAYGASPPRRTDRRYRDACLSALEYPR